jgi:hypothetical protein
MSSTPQKMRSSLKPTIETLMKKFMSCMKTVTLSLKMANGTTATGSSISQRSNATSHVLAAVVKSTKIVVQKSELN